MSSKIKVDTIENVAGSGNVSLGSGHNLVVPGNLNVDTNLLDVDASNDTVGIGTAVNTRKLNINAGSFGHMLLDTADASHGVQILGQTNATANSGFDIQYSSAGGLKMRTLAVKDISLQTSASAGSPAEALKIDTAGRVFKPLQPAFSASSSSDQTVTTDTEIVFNQTSINVGNHFNTSNNRFTAPVAGTYLFHSTISVKNVSSTGTYLAFYFKKNGTGTGFRMRFQADNRGGEWDGTSGHAILSLAANDYITLGGYNESGSFQMQGSEAHFSGYLLQ